MFRIEAIFFKLANLIKYQYAQVHEKKNMKFQHCDEYAWFKYPQNMLTDRKLNSAVMSRHQYKSLKTFKKQSI